MQLFPSQTITSQVSFNSEEEEKVEKNIKRNILHILTVCVDGFSKRLSLRKDKCYCDTVDGGDGPQRGTLKT